MLQPTLTNNGIALMVKAFCGGEIQFSKLKIGNGSAEGIDIKTLNDIINPIKNINISRMDRNDNNVILVGTGYDNSEVESDIIWNEVGVYATDPDEGEILFAYINTKDALEIIKSNQSGVSIENNLSVMLLISSDVNVSAVITSIQYASKQELLDHITKSNPHGTTKEDIGLGNVENLAISDQQPEFDTGTSLTNIKVGDTLKTIISKVWSAINSLTSHLTANNPHKITISTIGAAAASHNHSVSNITSGILPISRGGTGVSNPSAMIITKTISGYKTISQGYGDAIYLTIPSVSGYKPFLYILNSIYDRTNGGAANAEVYATGFSEETDSFVLVSNFGVRTSIEVEYTVVYIKNS